MSNTPVYPISRRPQAPHASFLVRLYNSVQARLLRFTAVNELEKLTERQLRDVGIDRHQIEQVAAREIARLHAK